MSKKYSRTKNSINLSEELHDPHITEVENLNTYSNPWADMDFDEELDDNLRNELDERDEDFDI